jgi:3-hydroxybutyryl-CoA dehydratase
VVRRLSEFEPGDQLIPVTVLVTREKIAYYAEVSGDRNPIHLDQEFASGTEFGGLVAHGLLVVAYLSRMMTENFGAAWVENGELDVAFTAPVRPGDRVTARGRVLGKCLEEDSLAVHCDAWCETELGEKVLVGRASARGI